MPKDKLTELKKFDNPGSAHIMKTHLESAGIPCMLAGEDSTGFQPILTSRTGGIRLLVRESDKERALAVLAGEAPGHPGDPDYRNGWEYPDDADPEDDADPGDDVDPGDASFPG